MSKGDVTFEPMQPRASEPHDTCSSEHAAGAPGPATGKPTKKQKPRFGLDGPAPPVAELGDAPEHTPTASEQAYGALEDVLDRAGAVVGGASVQAIAALVQRHPQLGAPIFAAVEQTQGEPAARAASEELALLRSPTRVAEAAVPMDRRRKVAGFEQIARGHLREAGAPEVIELPASLVDALERAWQASDANQQETGGNVVRTYGGKYKLRRGEPGTGDMFEPDDRDVGWTETRIGTAHTHPYRKEGYDHGTFSSADLVNIVDESEPLKFLRSGSLTYVIARTKEFDALVKRHDQEQTLDDLKRAMARSYDDVFDAAPGAFPDKLEASVSAVCNRFHLVYYEGRGAELRRVGGPSIR